MAARKNLLGQKFGRLSPVEYLGGKWLCVCDCGEKRIVLTCSLTSGNTSSCGCLKRAVASFRMKKHGATIRGKSQEYAIWSLMRDRCNNKNNRKYSYYGGRGISVCKRWDDYANFLDDMGERPPGATIDRVNPDGDYEPSNCRWASRKDQSRNRAYCKVVVWRGETVQLWALADSYRIDLQLVHNRLHRGWALERAITQAKRPIKCH